MSRHYGTQGINRARACLITAGIATGLLVALVALFAVTEVARAIEVNREAKQDLPGGSSHQRICDLSEADNIEILNRRSPNAQVRRFKGDQARVYTYILQTGNKINGRSDKIKWHLSGPFTANHAGYSVRFPVPDTLYIVKQPNGRAVFPFFIVDGCVARISFQYPVNLHRAILAQMEAHPT